MINYQKDLQITQWKNYYYKRETKSRNMKFQSYKQSMVTYFKCRKMILFVFLFSFSNIKAQSAKQVFESPDLPSLVSSAKMVAILPFKVSISYKKAPKGMTLEQNKDNEKAESTQMQEGMYTYLLRKSKDFSVSFLEVDRTNALLRKANVFDRVDELTADTLCKILGVDALIKSSYSYQKIGTQGGAIATALLFGVASNTGSGQLVMQINRATDGAMMWRMSKEMNEGAFSSANELMERMMRKVGRNFPFQK